VEHRTGWEKHLERWLTPFLDALGDKRRRQWAPLYIMGLLLPGDRKSMQPISARVAPEDVEQIHHFVGTSSWDTAPVEEVLWHKADALLGGDASYLIVDDTGLPKKGTESVGVAHQYCGALGKQANCQCLVSLTLARNERIRAHRFASLSSKGVDERSGPLRAGESTDDDRLSPEVADCARRDRSDAGSRGALRLRSC
jgi:SRSO17 transposase